MPVMTSVNSSVSVGGRGQRRRQHGARRARHGRRRGGDDVGQLEADAGQRHDADDDADGGGGGADRQRVFGAVAQALEHFPKAHAFARVEKPDGDAQGDAPEGGHVGRVAGDQDGDQRDQRDHGWPVAPEGLFQVRHLLGAEAAQAVALGLEMHLHEDAEEMHEGRHDRRQDDGRVGQPQELDHQEGGGAHDRRRDLAARRGGRFDRGREMLLVAEADHRRDRQRADRHRVGDGRARDHAEQSRAEDRHLGRAAGIAACHPGGAVKKELAEADARGEDAEQHEVEDVGRDDAEGDAVDALAWSGRDGR